MRNIQLVPNAEQSYKIGTEEIVGLLEAMTDILVPVRDALNDMETWSGEGWFSLESTEYKSRAGFMPYSHNCGGVEINAVIPKVGESDFSFVNFGECDECTHETLCGYEGMECGAECDGHLNAKLRVWLKFEGIQSDGSLGFYLYMGGGNGDAPYFRTKAEETYFEASFSCKSVKGLKRAAAKHIVALMKVIGAQ